MSGAISGMSGVHIHYHITVCTVDGCITHEYFPMILRLMTLRCPGQCVDGCITHEYFPMILRLKTMCCPGQPCVDGCITHEYFPMIFRLMTLRCPGQCVGGHS